MSGWLHRGPLGAPWAALLLWLGCVLTTLPTFFRERYYLVLGTGYEGGDNPHYYWWHPIVTTFLHGGGPPGRVVHLTINSLHLLLSGALLERALGRGRFVSLTVACLAVEIAVQVATGHHGHGISSVVWGYNLFVPVALAHAWRAERARALRDPAFVLLALWMLPTLLGMVIKWHALSVLVTLPFFVAWRGVFRSNLARIDRGEAPDVWGGAARVAGMVVPGALCAFTAAIAAGAVLGLLR